MDMKDYIEGYDQAEASEGIIFQNLVNGQYPLTISRIQERAANPNTDVPFVRLIVRCYEGPCEGQTAFLKINLTHNPYRWIDGEDGERGSYVARNAEEIDDARRKHQGRMRGIMAALGLPPSFKPSVGPDDPDFIYQFLGLSEGNDKWSGRQFIGDLRNSEKYGTQINAWRNLEHPKQGLTWWRAVVLPKQVSKHSSGNSSSTTAAEQGTSL